MEALVTLMRGGTGGGAAPLSTAVFGSFAALKPSCQLFSSRARSFKNLRWEVVQAGSRDT